MPDVRRPVVAANWKMHKTIEEAERFVAEFLPRAGDLGPSDVVLCPPFLALKTVVELCLQSRVRVAAQNMHDEPEGAFTGEVSAGMLREVGVDGVILGHSERRHLFGESDEALARKVPAALEADLEPILCVGETESQRDEGATESVLRRQIEADLAVVHESELTRVVIAYEPVWAIGTGRTATSEQASEAIAFIRSLIADRNADAGVGMRILYGGSVKPDNAAELLGLEGIDGALVGGASLDPEAFRRDRLGGPHVSQPDRPVPAVVLVVLDGWGLAPDGPGNAIGQASTPTFDALLARYPHTTLNASGPAVGLPDGQMGNSEVGHLNLGAGAVIKQDLLRIDDAIADGSFFENPVLREACEKARSGPRGRLHLMGLVSDGGVHSGWEHIEACIELAAAEGVPDLVVHAFTDGRDTLPHSSPGYLEEVERWLRRAGRIGTVSGRYYAMDRDRRWERTKLAYDAIVHAEGERAESAIAAARASHEQDVTDEFIRPTVIGDYDGMEDGDGVLFFNFRPDRARQLVRALGEPDFSEFPRGVVPNVHVATMTEYQAEWDYRVAFPPRTPETTLAQVIAERGERQLHVAETEKYAHVTYFFNGGREVEWEGEDRRLVDSPRDVPTYDHKPEMSAHAVADAFCERWLGDGYRFGVINFANADMVGHTGDIPAAVSAVETADACLGQVLEAVEGSGGATIVTADHGNADNMLEPNGSPNTAHSTNPVPLVVTVEGLSLRDGGVLADVAPTVLELLRIDKPDAMTGSSLIAD